MRTLTLALAASLLFLPGMDGCPNDLEDGTGYVDESWTAARATAYLEYATQEHSDSPLNAIAHMERDLTDPGYTAPVGQVDVGAWQRRFDLFATYEDTRDFGGLYMLNVLLGYEGHPYITPAMWDRIREALLSFKMWYTDATPAVPDPSDPDCQDPPEPGGDGLCRDWDNSFYWTENHQILYHTIEYLAGQRFPDVCFTQVGFTPTGTCDGVDDDGRPFEMTGQEHMDRARPFILRWLDDRWELGWSEWHSNIYYQKDVTPLLTLVEFAEDEEIATRSAILLDQILLDLAVHSHRDTFGVTAGRSAMKDKWRGPRNDTWGITHLLFRQQTEIGFQSTGDAGATLLARAKEYRLPQVILDAALHDGTFVDRERHSLWIDETADAPDAPVPQIGQGPFYGDPDYDPIEPDDDPNHAFDVDLADAAAAEPRFTFWWGLGAWTVWQVVPLTLATGDAFNLWNTNLLRDFQDLRTILGPLDEPVDVDGVQFGQIIALGLWPLAAVGLLKEANTYTYRTPDYVLSTVQKYRPGANAGQVHAWNLTIDPETMVFTTHPMIPPEPPSRWIGRDEGEPGNWTGTASMPVSGQHENVGIHLYSPVYPDGGNLGFFDFEAETHAWWPQDRFDETIQAGPWTFGRKGDVYVALYSWRGTSWRSYPQAELDLLDFTQDFELVADGPPPPEVTDPTVRAQGPDNVWIVEVGTADAWGSFAAFRDAVLAADLTVTATPGPIKATQNSPTLRHQVFEVAYDSPSQGLVTFGNDAPLVVAGEEMPLDDYLRFDNPWIRMRRGAPTAVMYSHPAIVFHDWPAGERIVARGPGS